jgi:hypothetical protein
LSTALSASWTLLLIGLMPSGPEIDDAVVELFGLVGQDSVDNFA